MDALQLRNFRVGQLALKGAYPNKEVDYLYLIGIDKIYLSDELSISEISLIEDKVIVGIEENNGLTLDINKLSNNVITDIIETLFAKALEIANKEVIVNVADNKIKLF
jgi:hypothetical protein